MDTMVSSTAPSPLGDAERSQTSPEFFFVSDDDDSAFENGATETPSVSGAWKSLDTIDDWSITSDSMNISGSSSFLPLECKAGEGTAEVAGLSREARAMLEPTPIGPNCFYFAGSSGQSLPLGQNSLGYKSGPKNKKKLAQQGFMASLSSHFSADMKRCVSISTTDSSGNDEWSMDSSTDSKTKQDRFRVYQEDQWMTRFRELKEYHSKHGHCLVPHYFAPNQALAQWVKRQRYQYKLKHMLKRHSTLTDVRQKELEKLGFVWNFHSAAWYGRLESLKKFKSRYGHTSVPGNSRQHKSLAIWVKCQRRQMKCLKRGLQSSLTEDRIEALERIGFIWNPRNLV